MTIIKIKNSPEGSGCGCLLAILLLGGLYWLLGDIALVLVVFCVICMICGMVN